MDPTTTTKLIWINDTTHKPRNYEKVYYTHNEVFWKEPSKPPSMSKNGLSQTGRGDWLGLHGLEEEACVRVSAHRLGPMWFEFPTNTKGGSGCTILLAFLDTGQEGEGRDERKLSAVKLQKLH